MAGWLVWSLRRELNPFFLAFVFAYVLEPGVRRLTARGWSRPAAISGVYLAALALVAGAGYLGWPILAREAGRMVHNLPGTLRRWEDWRRNLESGYRQAPWPAFVRRAFDDGLRGWGSEAAGLVQRSVTGLVASVPATVMDLVLVPILGYYFLRDGPNWRGRLFGWIPSAHRPAVAVLGEELNGIWAGFLRGQLAVAAVIAVAGTVILHFLGVRYSLLLGLMSGLGDLIPYFGPLVGAAAATGVALEKSALTALLVVLAFAALHWTEENLLSPRLLGDRLGLHPAAVIAALVVGGELGGLWGLFLAVPVAGMLRPLGEFLRRFWEGREG